MSTVYVDVLVSVNIFIDFFLILCAKKFLNISVSLKRMIAGSLIGGILSLTALLPKIPTGLSVIQNLIFAALIVFSVFGKTDLKSFIKRLGVFFSFSFSFCGIMIFLYTQLKPKGMKIYNNIVYFNISPVLMIILTLLCYYILKIIKKLTGGVYGNHRCIVEITQNSNTFVFTAIIDTGCNLKEPFSGDYVIIAAKNVVDESLFEKSKMRIIPFSGICGSGILRGYPPDSVRLDGKILGNKIYIGFGELTLKGDAKGIVPYGLTCHTISQ